MVTELNRIDIELSLQSDYLTSLLNYNRKLKDGNISNQFPETYWWNLYESLGPNHQDEYCNNIVSIALEQGKNTLSLLKLNSEIFFRGSYYKSNPEKILDLITGLTEYPEIDILEWIKKNISKFLEYQKAINDSDTEKYKNKLVSIRDDEDMDQGKRVIISDFIDKLYNE